MIVWMIVDKTDYSLPVAVFSTLRECSEFLSVPLDTLKTAFKRHGTYKGKFYNLERVIIDEKAEFEVMGFK